MFRILYDASKILKKDRERILKDSSSARKIRQILERFSENPFSRAFDLKKLEPKDTETYRLRIGDHRVIFSIDFGNQALIIHRIAKRDEVYEK